uniref:Uncharacterized protein n=1 Tax=Mucochytrium quahogii TaxID=96639 RepID=A0A7S2SD84_9STRA|mmetsp:Transcript_8956/g.14573  ORF Transcript_8956/g.14573 Transcript_8956/m.14573 type:complete len:266 (+) Transcript_8956:2662-3459(+)
MPSTRSGKRSRDDPDAGSAQRKCKSKESKEDMGQLQRHFMNGFKVQQPSDHARHAVFRCVYQWAKGEGRKLDSALYPGSYIDIVPSLTIRRVVYVDNFTGNKGHVQEFFAPDNRDELVRTLLGQRAYEGAPQIGYYNQDFTNKDALSEEKHNQFDALISFSAGGNISRTCHKFVRQGGLLIVNDDFGDASSAMGPRSPWKLLAGFDGSRLETAKLDAFFKLKKTKQSATREQCAQNVGFAYSKRPFKFTQNALAYVFEKVDPEGQ